jgi:Ca2+-binding EF-hand superfamily protein
MKKLMVAGIAATALIAIPALAFRQDPGPMGGPGEPMMGPMTRADVEKKVETHFSQMDANHDGFVTRDEAKSGKVKMHVQRHERRQEMREGNKDEMFARLDSDGNGSISRAEFDAHFANGMGHKERKIIIRRKMKGQEHGMMFDQADADKDGRLSLAEAMQNHMAMFDRADADKNGIVTPEEHQAMMKMRRDKHQD